MQRYQVFIDEHSISIGEIGKSNQQFNSIFELFEPTADDINHLVKWLSIEKEQSQKVFLHTSNVQFLWELFQNQFKRIDAAGGLVFNSMSQVLFIHRLGKWDLPKGKMEKGESPEESALREVEEESGISNLSIEKQLAETFHIYYHKNKFVLKCTFWFRMNYKGNEELVPQTEEAIEEAVWVDSNNMRKQVSNTYASLEAIISEI